MKFANREEAARQLARKLVAYRGKNPLVLAIPRGAVVMARIIADALEGEADVVLVRKLRAPGQPELAIGAVDEHGHAILSGYVSPSRVSDSYLEDETKTQIEALRRRRATYARPAADPRGRVVIVVDDGVATGSTMIAALKAVRHGKPSTLVAAAAVAPKETVGRLEDFADDVVCLSTPSDFRSVGQYFDDFKPVSDEEVIALLKKERRDAAKPVVSEVSIPAGGHLLRGNLACPAGAKGLVVFAHGSGSSRLSSRNRHVAEELNRNGMATLLFDLLTSDEDRSPENRFNVRLLGERLVQATEWIMERPEAKGLPIGYFGASTGAAAAMVAAAQLGGRVACIVSRGGRPDLAIDAARHVVAPTLFIVGSNDPDVLEFNRRVCDVLPETKELSVVRGASHLFEEPGMLDEVTRLAVGWFGAHLQHAHVIPSSHAPSGGKHVVTTR